MSMIGTTLALVGLAAVKRPSERQREREEIEEHLAYVERELAECRAERDFVRVERDALRDEIRRLLSGAHRCQHQAQLNRAMAQQQEAAGHQAEMLREQMRRMHAQQMQQMQQVQAQHLNAGLGQAQQLSQYQNALNDVRCGLRLDDCNMHRVELGLPEGLRGNVTRLL